jgi:phage regulator Rha-like protein
MADKNTIVSVKQIESLILIIRGQRVMLDSDLAELYGVTTSRLNEQVKRNRERFPQDFMFQLTGEEFKILMSQFAISRGHGGRRKLPYVFTEHGAIMAANVLNSERAVEMSVYVVRAFVKLREMLATHKEMARKLTELEKRLDSHDEDIRALVIAVRKLMAPPSKPKKQIGFRLEK